MSAQTMHSTNTTNNAGVPPAPPEAHQKAGTGEGDKTQMIPSLEVRPYGRRWGVFAGKSRLATHPTKAAAQRAMETKRKLYEYWAGSASTSVENTPARIVSVTTTA